MLKYEYTLKWKLTLTCCVVKYAKSQMTMTAAIFKVHVLQ